MLFLAFVMLNDHGISGHVFLISGHVFLISGHVGPRAEVACRLAAVIKDDGGGGASQRPSWSQIRLEVE